MPALDTKNDLCSFDYIAELHITVQNRANVKPITRCTMSLAWSPTKVELPDNILGPPRRATVCAEGVRLVALLVLRWLPNPNKS